MVFRGGNSDSQVAPIDGVAAVKLTYHLMHDGESKNFFEQIQRCIGEFNLTIFHGRRPRTVQFESIDAKTCFELGTSYFEAVLTFKEHLFEAEAPLYDFSDWSWLNEYRLVEMQSKPSKPVMLFGRSAGEGEDQDDVSGMWPLSRISTC